MTVYRHIFGKRSAEEAVGSEEAHARANIREIAEVCENTTELDMDVIEKAFEETPSYEKKLQEAREKHLGTLVDLNTFEVIYEEDFVSEKALSTAWVDKSPDGNEAKSRLCVRGFEQRLQKDVSFFSPTPSTCRCARF